MIKPEQRRELGVRFGWWWLDIAEAMLPVYLKSPHGKTTCQIEIPPDLKGPPILTHIKPNWTTPVHKLPREEQTKLCLAWYVEYYSEHAFRYELHGRRGFTENGIQAKVAYEHGKPFHKLTNAQIEWLANRHTAQRKKQPFAYTACELKDIASPRIVESMLDKAKAGWSEPKLMSFNLKECADVEILKRIAKFLRFERARLGIPRSHGLTGKRNAASKIGTPFTQIEALDVWTRLPRTEASNTGYAEKQARDARKAIAELRGEI